jgi:hypothetical protein
MFHKRQLKLRLQIRDVGLRRQNQPADEGRLRDVVAAISIAAIRVVGRRAADGDLRTAYSTLCPFSTFATLGNGVMSVCGGNSTHYSEFRNQRIRIIRSILNSM